MKRILGTVLAVIMLVISVAASDLPDPNQMGSICITITYDGKPVAGGELTLHRVGDIKEENGNYGFVLTDRFAAFDITSENLLSPEMAKKLSDHITRERVTGKTEKIDTEGSITFDNLKVGLYLVVQSKAATGYQKLNSFLVSLPMQEATGYSYHVDASPKVSLTPKPPVNTELPETGQSVWPVWLFLFSSAALALLVRKGKYI